MKKIILSTIVAFASIFVTVSAHAADRSDVIDAGTGSVMSAIQHGYVKVNQKIPVSECISPNDKDVREDLKAIPMTCKTSTGEVVDVLMDMVYEPSTEAPTIGGDDAYAPDGTIKVWAVWPTNSGKIKVTSTVTVLK